MAAKLDKPWRKWLPVLAAMIIPGSGHVILGRSKRGLILLFWMILFGFVTHQLAGEEISVVGKFSGGLAVWVISVLEVAKISQKR